MNGKETEKWVKKGCDEEMRLKLPATTPIASHCAIVALAGWMRQLLAHLLSKDEWSEAKLSTFRLLVVDIQHNWLTHTNARPFPKLHMLTHALEFASQRRHLGKYAESQIESFHFLFTSKYNITHNNQGSSFSERMRRSLADTLLKRAKPAIALL
jgi:hypothetical protein